MKSIIDLAGGEKMLQVSGFVDQGQNASGFTKAKTHRYSNPGSGPHDLIKTIGELPNIVEGRPDQVLSLDFVDHRRQS